MNDRKCQTCGEIIVITTSNCPRCGADDPTLPLAHRTGVYAAKLLALLAVAVGLLIAGGGFFD